MPLNLIEPSTVENNIDLEDALTVASISDSMESAIAVMNESLAESEPGFSTMAAWVGGAPVAEPTRSTLCTQDRFAPAVFDANSTCEGTEGDRTVRSFFNYCEDPFTNDRVNGVVTLTFETPEACNHWLAFQTMPDGLSLTRTSDRLVRFDPSGATQVVSSSTPHRTFENEVVTGGVSTVSNPQGAFGRKMTIHGVHRVRKTALGTGILFDHSVRTKKDLWMSVNARFEPTAQSGSIQIDNNSHRYTAVLNLNDLSWRDLSCCYPTSGIASIRFTGALSGTLNLDFNTGKCGEASVEMLFGTRTTITLPECRWN